MNQAHAVLRTSDLGQSLSGEDFDKLMALLHENSIEPNITLFHQHSLAKSVYLVTRGVVRVEKLSAHGRRQVVAFLFAGDFLGLTHNEYYEYSATALIPSQVLEASRNDFLKLSDQCAQLRQNLSNISNNVLSRALDQVFALGQKKAHERLCFLIQQVQERYPSGQRTLVQLPMTRQDIADYLGLTIETVSRALAKLKKDGVICDVTLQSLVIADERQLEALACLD